MKSFLEMRFRKVSFWSKVVILYGLLKESVASIRERFGRERMAQANLSTDEQEDDLRSRIVSLLRTLEKR